MMALPKAPRSAQEVTQDLAVCTREICQVGEEYSRVIVEVMTILQHNYPAQKLNVLLGVGGIGQHVAHMLQAVNQHTQAINAIFHDLDVLLGAGVDIGAAALLRGARQIVKEPK